MSEHLTPEREAQIRLRAILGALRAGVLAIEPAVLPDLYSMEENIIRRSDVLALLDTVAARDV